MQVPPEIAFRHVQASDHLKSLILDGIDRLEKIYPNLISCRTLVDDMTPDRQNGNEYRVRLEIGIPGSTIIVDKSDSEHTEYRDVTQVINEAFDIARKRVQKAKELQRGDVKVHELPPHGRVTRLLTDDTGVRYGFIEARDGRQIYFHEESLVDLEFEDLDIGDEVRYAGAEGDEGPQASTVARLDGAGLDRAQERSVPLRQES
jgi:cold shock CspA family protein/ribosome-associated translation inhibitor RaiA